MSSLSLSESSPEKQSSGENGSPGASSVSISEPRQQQQSWRNQPVVFDSSHEPDNDSTSQKILDHNRSLYKISRGNLTEPVSIGKHSPTALTPTAHNTASNKGSSVILNQHQPQVKSDPKSAGYREFSAQRASANGLSIGQEKPYVAPKSNNINQILKREWKERGRKRNYRTKSEKNHNEVGWEPGVDIRNTEVELGENSVVTITDYNVDRYRVVSKIDKHSIDQFLKDKQPWATVRWINVKKLSWDVVKSISEFYALHPLAVEDIFDIPRRAKADHYKNQTFCSLPLHKLVNTKVIDDYFDSQEGYSLFSRLFGKQKKPDKNTLSSDLVKVMAENNMMTMQEWNNPTLDKTYLDYKRSLGRYHEVVAIEQVSIFLIEDHTIISFFENAGDDIEGPILSHIATPNTLLRESPEPSLLLQAILDNVVDIAFGIISEYQKYIVELQADVFISASMRHTRDLHVLSEEIAMLKATLMPIYSLVQTLRDHAHVSQVMSPNEKVLTGGHISEYAKLYLSDVADHVISFTDNLDLMRHTTENMINLIFNTMSVQENEAMRQLTLITIIFLPLTFMTGYFGMNFNEFGALDNTPAYFWYIAIPVTVFIIIIISWSWIAGRARRVRQVYRKQALRRREDKKKILVKKYEEDVRRQSMGSHPIMINATDQDSSDIQVSMPDTPSTGTRLSLQNRNMPGVNQQGYSDGVNPTAQTSVAPGFNQFQYRTARQRTHTPIQELRSVSPSRSAPSEIVLRPETVLSPLPQKVTSLRGDYGMDTV
ncbi:hypothetical protein V1511DRAFT_508719 [Dipodascopsis uninucleata]